MKTEKQPFEDVSPIKDGVFPSCHLIVLEGIYALAFFFFLVVLAIQVGFTKEFGGDPAICRERGIHAGENTSPTITSISSDWLGSGIC